MRRFVNAILLILALASLSGQAALAARPEAGGAEMEEGLALFYQGRWDEAIASFDKVLEADPHNTLAISYILDASYKKRDINGMISQIEQRSIERGEDPDAQAQLGMAYFLRGMVIPNVLDEALTEFKQALKSDPSQPLACTGVGLVYFQKRMMPRAKGYFVRALQLNPHDVMAMDRLGNILLVDEQKPAEAMALFERILAELPTYPDGHYFKGSALHSLKEYDQALPYLERALELDPKGFTQGFDAATLLGDIYLQLERFPEAVEAFEAARQIRPDSKYAQLKLEKARAGQTP